MINPEFEIFKDNMFVKAHALIADLTPASDMDLLDLTVGEPQMPPPDWLSDALADKRHRWQAYPKVAASQQFLDDVHVYLASRFTGVADKFKLSDHIVPIPGTREPLHFLGHCVRGAKQSAAALVTNPFYHAWRAGALASGGEILFLNAAVKTGFLPDLGALDEAVLKRTTIMYLCSPSNPHGVIATHDYLADAILLARRYDFLLVMDECYIDIWRNNKPVSALEVAAQLPHQGDIFSHLVIVNSLSKRSNAAGVRAGFLCGDKRVIVAYKVLVANGGALVPTPLLEVAGALYRDQDHNKTICAYYETSFALADKALSCGTPDGGFFLWLETPASYHADDKQYVRDLYAQAGIKAVPGSLMGVTVGGVNPASGYVRFALVHEHAIIEKAMTRLARYRSEPHAVF
jgi:N-succinyldiaminopimelate aminotransferase